MIKKVHYPNLNSLRFIAALVVIVHHTEQIKFAKGLPNLWNNVVIAMLGKLGVDLFFVLSGFLITSLLFIEKSTVPQISVKNFIVRRILRIWPLYFIIMAIGFYIMPHFSLLSLGAPFVNVHDHMFYNILMYVLFIPHIQLIAFGPILYSAQAWSIGIEEQFYVFWPFLVKYLNKKKLILFIVIYITAYLFICFMLAYLKYRRNGLNFMSYDTLSKTTTFFIEILKFDCLLIGGLFAIINNKIKDSSFFINKYFQISIYLTEAILIYTGYNFHGFSWEIHAVSFGIIIMNLVRTKTSIFNINYPVFDYLGKISYGIYMYHILVINLIITLFFKLNLMIWSYPAILLSVVLISSISYKFIESYFLQKKKAFSIISTG